MKGKRKRKVVFFPHRSEPVQAEETPSIPCLPPIKQERTHTHTHTHTHTYPRNKRKGKSLPQAAGGATEQPVGGVELPRGGL